jgi:hypothetical protein
MKPQLEQAMAIAGTVGLAIGMAVRSGWTGMRKKPSRSMKFMVRHMGQDGRTFLSFRMFRILVLSSSVQGFTK